MMSEIDLFKVKIKFIINPHHYVKNRQKSNNNKFTG